MAPGRLLARFTTRRRRPSRGIHDAARRIRDHLESAAVVRAAVEEVVRAAPSARCSVWVVGRRGEPHLAYPVPSDGPPPLPVFVLGSARRRKRLRDTHAGLLALPLIAPRAGVLGVLYLEDLHDATSEQEAFLEDLAHELAFALEASSLYEQALAQKERSEAILSRVADAVVVTDARGVLRQFNRSAVEILGFDPPRAARHACAEVLRLHIGTRALDCSAGCALLQLSSAAHGLGVEVTRTLPDGRTQPLLANASAVAGVDGQTAEVVHSFRDITRLKEADEAKTMFLATASHELKTPLTVIRGFSEMLVAEGNANGSGEAVEAIARRSAELGKIVDRILLSSRIESGRADVSLVDLDLAPVILERTDAFAKATGRLVRASVESGLPFALADPEAFATVLDHLVDNAIKYSPDGGAIEVRAVAREATIDVSVRDHGIGMTSEQAARCFEKFFQGESSDVRRFGGTGIGLYIVRSLVEAMGGSVKVSSEPGQGSRFTATLRRADAARDEERAAQGGDAPDAPEPSQIREFMRQMGIRTTGGAQGGRR